MKLKLVDNSVVFTDDSGNPVEMFSTAKEGKAAEMADNSLPAGLPTPDDQKAPGEPQNATVKASKGTVEVGAVKTDPKHPFVVILCGVPLFASSSKVPERVMALLSVGMSPLAFQILDVRDGSTHTLKVSK